jgi:hypothetical protein
MPSQLNSLLRDGVIQEITNIINRQKVQQQTEPTTHIQHRRSDTNKADEQQNPRSRSNSDRINQNNYVYNQKQRTNFITRQHQRKT